MDRLTKIKENKKKLALVVAVIIVLSLTLTLITKKTEGDVHIRLQEYLIPIETTEAGNNYEDLLPLKEILEDKRIVALGEATHGTREFFQMKHRIFQFLVEEMDFRIFAIEDNFGSGQIVNDYILNGNGTLEQAVRTLDVLFWHTEEVANMIQWMREFNKDPNNERKIKFYGFDVQDATKGHWILLDYLKQVDEAQAEAYQFTLARPPKIQYSNDKQQLNQYKESMERLLDEVRLKENEYVFLSSKEEYDMILQHINVIIKVIEHVETGMENNDRDYNMAETVKWILEYEAQFSNDKIMLWAHNGHVSKSFHWTSMGEHLSKAFDDEYYAIAFDTYEGKFRSIPYLISFNGVIMHPNYAKFKIQEPWKNHIASQFEKTEIPISFLDFHRAVRDDTLNKYFNGRRWMNLVGAGYYGSYMIPNYLEWNKPAQAYDGIIFIRETTPSVSYGYRKTIEDGDQYISDYYRAHRIVLWSLLLLLPVGGYLFKKYRRKLRQ